MKLGTRALWMLPCTASMALLFHGTAAASTITFTLNCSMTAAATCGAPTGPFGTVTIADNANLDWVDITVNLTNGELLTRLFLNYGKSVPAGYGFTVTDPGSTVAAGVDNQGSSPYGLLMFDIKIADAANANNPYTTVLKLQKASSPDQNLDPLDFDVKDANNLLFAAVNHTGPGSQKGALTDVSITSFDATAVPEPSTLGLLAIGLLGTAVRRLRAKR